MAGARLALNGLAGLVAGLLVITSNEAYADDPVGPTVRVTIDGTMEECHDDRGRAVAIYEVTDLGDAGRAGLIAQTPFIMLDEEVMRRLPGRLQTFFYLHECAHLTLGHYLSYSPEHENEADCWAIHEGRDRRLFSRQDVVDFAPWLAKSRGDPFGHLPGPVRAAALLACFDESAGATVAAQ
jgi:hypothetical protein